MSTWADKQREILKNRKPERFKGWFKAIQDGSFGSYVRSRGPNPKVIPVDAELATKAALLFESLTVMAEEAPPEEMINILIRNDELAHFVSYMRTLDKEYRTLLGVYQKMLEKKKE